MLDDGLPSYDDPPVQEVAVSVQFAPLPPSFLVHYGRIWTELEADYPRCDVQPPLAPMQIAPARPMIRFDLDAVPTARAWFISDDDTRLVQLQPDRVAFNWRRRGDAAYPRWSEVSAEFNRIVALTTAYCESNGFDALRHRAVEVTYHNIHLLSPDERPEQYLRAFREDRGTTEEGPPVGLRLQEIRTMTQDNFSGSLVSDAFLADNTDGNTDGKELHLQLVATIDLANDTAPNAVGRAAELGRATIVRSFTHQTTEYAHDRWRLIRGNDD